MQHTRSGRMVAAVVLRAVMHRSLVHDIRSQTHASIKSDTHVQTHGLQVKRNEVRKQQNDIHEHNIRYHGACSTYHIGSEMKLAVADSLAERSQTAVQVHTLGWHSLTECLPFAGEHSLGRNHFVVVVQRCMKSIADLLM